MRKHNHILFILQSIVVVLKLCVSAARHMSRRQKYVVEDTMSLMIALPSLEFSPEIGQAQTSPLDQLHPAADLMHSLATASTIGTATTTSTDEMVVVMMMMISRWTFIETAQSAETFIFAERRNG